MDRNVLGCIELLEEIVMQGRELVQFVTDFTWYLRNLMLVQTADNLEDVIDMSTDNLANLKEEASMLSMRSDHPLYPYFLRTVRTDPLCGAEAYPGRDRADQAVQAGDGDRSGSCPGSYPSGRGKSGKRYCRYSAQMPAGAPGVQGGPQGGAARPKPELPKAIPEDVQEIVRKWPAIVGNAENPMKMYLKNARLSLGGDNKLMVVLEDGLASDYFKGEAHEQNKQQLEALLSDFSGKEIEVTIQTVESSRAVRRQLRGPQQGHQHGDRRRGVILREFRIATGLQIR